jgi:hypothetical protein
MNKMSNMGRKENTMSITRNDTITPAKRRTNVILDLA